MKTKNNMRKKIITFTLTAAMVSTLSFASFAVESVPPLDSTEQSTFVTYEKANQQPITDAEDDSLRADANTCQTQEELYECMIEHGFGIHIIVGSAALETPYTQSLIADYEAAGLPYTIEVSDDVDASAKQFFTQNFERNDGVPVTFSDAPPTEDFVYEPHYPQVAQLIDDIQQDRVEKFG